MKILFGLAALIIFATLGAFVLVVRHELQNPCLKYGEEFPVTTLVDYGNGILIPMTYNVAECIERSHQEKQ